MKDGYKVEIKSSVVELTPKQRVMVKTTSDAQRIQDVAGLVFKPYNLVELMVHNEFSKGDNDYVKYIIFDTDGNMYTTGSEHFVSALADIMSDMAECKEEWAVKVISKPSKNYSGDFYTVELV